MGIKEKYQIDDATWKVVQKKFVYGILLGIPFAASVFAFCTWPIIDGFSWTLVPIIPWGILYMIALPMYSLFLVRSKHTLLVMTLALLLFSYSFAVLASASVFRFFGALGLIIQSVVLLLTSVFLSTHYYKYYGKVWESHDYHNEEVVLDQENARYDFLNHFNLDESKLIKKTGKGYSNPFFISLISFIAPLSVAGGIILSRNGMGVLVIVIGWVLSAPVSLGFIKPLMGNFYNYRKLAYFEKKLGKPIINGLIE